MERARKELAKISRPGSVYVVNVGKLNAPLSIRSYMAWRSEA